jgi:glucose/arabinose dehydrogenase
MNLKSLKQTLHVAICLVASALGAPLASAQSLPADLTLTQFPNATTTFSFPIGLRHAGDSSGRVFVYEKTGTIKIVKNGVVNATPFISIPVSAPSGSEQGLLGLAFHPDFETNRKFYVAYTRTGGTPLGASADQVLAEYTVPVATPDVADPASRREILAIPDLASNHNGGDLHFGSDGYLYYSMGDGGPQNDPNEVAQNLWRKTINTREYYLLGKIMRLDIDGTTPNAGAELCATTTGQTAQYRIPADNPMVASSSTCDEIFHYGMRNPWRFSFDRRTGEIFVADVGQGTKEEVSIAGARRASNFGWKCYEGTNTVFTTGLCNPLPTNVTQPFTEYLHADAGGGFRCSIGGGYSYRGPIAAMQGAYFYNDYCSGEIWWSRRDGSVFTSAVWRDNNGAPVGFGEDELGNLYLIDSGGVISRFTSATDSDFVFGHGAEG